MNPIMQIDENLVQFRTNRRMAELLNKTHMIFFS